MRSPFAFFLLLLSPFAVCLLACWQTKNFDDLLNLSATCHCLPLYCLPLPATTTYCLPQPTTTTCSHPPPALKACCPPTTNIYFYRRLPPTLPPATACHHHFPALEQRHFLFLLSACQDIYCFSSPHPTPTTHPPTHPSVASHCGCGKGSGERKVATEEASHSVVQGSIGSFGSQYNM